MLRKNVQSLKPDNMSENQILPGDLHANNAEQITRALNNFFKNKKFAVVISKGGSHQSPSLTTNVTITDVGCIATDGNESVKVMIIASNNHFILESDKHNHVTFDLGPESLTIVLWSREFKKFIIFAVEKT